MSGKYSSPMEHLGLADSEPFFPLQTTAFDRKTAKENSASLNSSNLWDFQVGRFWDTQKWITLEMMNEGHPPPEIAGIMIRAY